ncbi:MAG: HTH domain-containing protein [Ezakiella coagulans]|uniref:HTH domain-containing protein n=1 Tax=Ezakiella coagulans TaxID=46507 RepID=UPI00399972FC
MINIMDKKPNITAEELSNIFSVSVITIKRDLKYLTEANLIKYVGSAKDGYWKIINTDNK